MIKKIIITWDLDGFVGDVNSTMPYNFNYDYYERELKCVERSLDFLKDNHIQTTYAVTGFSAERGQYPYTFPELISRISVNGHEIASHSWRHEWIPLFTKKQIFKSLERSKLSLERVIGDQYRLSGFVPPHNKPATWISRGAFSLEDKGLYPMFEMGDLSNLLKILAKTEYKWVRIAHNPLINRFRKKEFTLRQKLFNYKNILILENHYTGFDQKIINYIESNPQEYFTISAHPVMLDFNDGRPEAWENFERFINHFSNRSDIQFVRPMDILSSFGIH